MAKTSEAQRKAVAKYDMNNKAEKQYRNRKSAARTFITKYCRRDDVLELRKLIDERLEEER